MISQLKEQIFLKLGKEIENRGDCERLSRLIEVEIGEYLNYNTLRRFFDVDKQKFKPSASTLNILSRYIGFLSFEHFSSFEPQKVYFEQNLIMYEAFNYFQPELLSETFNKIEAYNNSRLTYLIQLCRFGLLSKQISELCAALDLMQLQKIPFSYDEIVIIGNSVGLLFRQIHLNRNDWKMLMTNAFFNEYIFEIFVDYSSLNAYYLKFIKCKHSSDEQRNFKLALMTLHHFLNQKKLTCKYAISDLSKINNYHPILQGRILSVNLYDDTAKEKMIISLDNPRIEHFYEPMVAAIISSNFTWYAFIKSKLNNFRQDSTHRDIHYFQVYLLLKCCFLYKNKKLSGASKTFKEIKIDQFRLSYKGLLSFFYFILDYKINGNDTSKLKANKLCQQLNYSRFDKDFIERY